ncbi:type I-E CRISPR-associated protein Cse1/CasA [Streptomyces sp. O3]
MAINLLDHPWLAASRAAVSGNGGAAAAQPVVGGLELILNAHEFSDITVDLPTQKPAIYRQLLLPFVVDALGWPDRSEWLASMSAGRFSAEQREKLSAYAERYRDRFDLFRPEDPFAQVPGLRTEKNETKGAALLVATAASGNNVPLFASRTEADPLPLPPAEAARWLLHTQCWDTAAIKTGVAGDPKATKGKTAGNPTSPLGQLGVIMPTGRTVFETIWLNIPFGRTPLPDDLPQWRRRAMDGDPAKDLSCATPVWQQRRPQGLLDLWTWQARRIRLFPEENPEGTRVMRVIVAAGDRLSAVPDEETHTAWRIETPTGRQKRQKRQGSRAAAPPPFRPRRHQPGKAGWRGMEAFLAVAREEREATESRAGFVTSRLLDQLREVTEDLPESFRLQLELTGIAYGNQSAVIEDIYSDSIPLPVVALDPDGIVYGALLEAADQAEQLANAVNTLSADLRRAAGTDPIPWDKGQRPGETLLHALDPFMRRLLAGLSAVDQDFDMCERGLLAWEQCAARESWRVARRLLAEAPPGAFSGRTVEKDGKERTYRLATAERGFRSRLTAVLPRRAAEA